VGLGAVGLGGRLAVLGGQQLTRRASL
jgi:hypothetical protein